MFRISRHKFIPLRHLKIFEVESRSYRASDHRERLPIGYVRSKPASRLNDCLKCLSGLRIISEQN